jgi:hypothetical protein
MKCLAIAAAVVMCAWVGSAGATSLIFSDAGTISAEYQPAVIAFGNQPQYSFAIPTTRGFYRGPGESYFAILTTKASISSNNSYVDAYYYSSILEDYPGGYIENYGGSDGINSQPISFIQSAGGYTAYFSGNSFQNTTGPSFASVHVGDFISTFVNNVSGVSFDLTFDDASIGDTYTFQVFETAVPEPSVWALLVIGFFSLGIALRRSVRLRPVAGAIDVVHGVGRGIPG